MPAVAGAAIPARRSRGASWRLFLPRQHGAWAMLAAPYLAGLMAAGYRWPDLPLLGAWIAGYLTSYYVFQTLKARRLGRYRRQVVLYAAMTAPLAALVLLARPGVGVYAPAYAAMTAVNAWHAYRRRERALLNDVTSVWQSCLMVFVVATVAGRVPQATPKVFLLCLMYFLGTVLYVKTMIRERGNRAYRGWSIGYHLLAFAVGAWLSPWAAILFGWLLLRAALLPRACMTATRVGVIEAVNSALLLACVALTI